MKTLRALIMPIVISLHIIEWIFRTIGKIVTGTAHGFQAGSRGIQRFLNHGALVVFSVIVLFLISALAGAL